MGLPITPRPFLKRPSPFLRYLAPLGAKYFKKCGLSARPVVFYPSLRGPAVRPAVKKSAANAASLEGFRAVIKSAASAASLRSRNPQKIVQKWRKHYLFGPFV